MLRFRIPAFCRSSLSATLSAMLFAGLLLSSGVFLHGQALELHVMPLPRSAQPGTGRLTLDANFHAGFFGQHDARIDSALDRILARLDHQCGGVRRAQFSPLGGRLTLTLQVAGPGGAVQSVDEDESYKLAVTASGAELDAATNVGAMHGLETFLQLVEVSGGMCWLPAVTIDDAPRFPWRGFMLDSVRHFQPIPVIERTLDAMTIAKLNVFHWHLSDDQAFRAESRKFPRFTQAGSDGH